MLRPYLRDRAFFATIDGDRDFPGPRSVYPVAGCPERSLVQHRWYLVLLIVCLLAVSCAGKPAATTVVEEETDRFTTTDRYSYQQPRAH